MLKVTEEELKKIPPWKLNEMMKLVTKISGIVLTPSTYLTSYDDAEFVLNQVWDAIQEARMRNEKVKRKCLRAEAEQGTNQNNQLQNNAETEKSQFTTEDLIKSASDFFGMKEE